MLLIGSRAAKIRFPDYREPKDYDIIGTEKEWGSLVEFFDNFDVLHDTEFKQKIRGYHQGVKYLVEYEFTERSSARTIWHHANQQNDMLYPVLGCGMHVASPTLLWKIKRSHLYWNIHWQKSIEDYHWIKSKTNQSVHPVVERFYTERVAELKQRFNQEFSFDTSNYDLDEFKEKLRHMCLSKYKSLTKENFIRVLKEIATSRIYESSSEMVIENYPKLIEGL